jgi:glucosamine kinase
MPRIVVGVDAGGTSTIAALAQDGHLIRTHEGGAANASSRGVEAASDTIAQTITAALDGGIPAAIFVGAAGAGREEIAQLIQETLTSRFPGARIAVRDDACIALRSAVPSGDGLVLIAGTGSVAYAEHDGVAFRAGGYGYLLGDEGSGFAIGSAAVRLLLRAYDERGPFTQLAHDIAAGLQAQSAMDVLARVYGNQQAVALIASLATIVMEAANRGERSANKIVQNAALELAQTVTVLAKRSGLAQTEAPVVFSGGLLRENTLLTYLLETHLRNEVPSMPIYKGDVAPYVGALAQAQALLT